MNNSSLIEKTLDFLTTKLMSLEGEGREFFMSSSFQTQSVPLLHLVSRNFRDVSIVFIDTGYLFAETYSFKKELQSLFDLKIITVSSNKGYSEQKASNGLFLYNEDTDRCCHINKVEPIEQLVKAGDVWISGVRRDQTSIRNKMKPVELDQRGVVRIHPMLEWHSKDIYDYIRKYDLPKHPLEKEGYMSLGCVPCTQKWSEDDLRGGRWTGRNKMECGLHTKNKKT